MHRVGRHTDALDAMARARALPGPVSDTVLLSNAALKVLVFAKLGDHEAAEAAMAEADEIAARMTPDTEALTLLAEARAALGR